jgi:hypothetical protein
MGITAKLAAAIVLSGMISPAFAQDGGQIAGAWRNPNGGSCEAPFFKATERTDSKRGEGALRGTVTHNGKTYTGDLILVGARRGQMVSLDTDTAMFLFDMPGGKLHMIPMGDAGAAVTEATLEFCPGTKPAGF